MAHTQNGLVLENGANSGAQRETAEEIALEEEKLKKDSEKDVRRQLEQQHVAESEEKAVEGIKEVAEKLLSNKGEAIEAKLAPVLGAAEHITEGAVNNGAADVEDLQEDSQELRQRIGSGHHRGALTNCRDCHCTKA
ncbi:hypothetical protein M404DRAFT_1000471 [Pisolithus tinctorius Marx 270]|uniref:Uncharacterized protein n=1 Tax=Pisolithus tinctorius Marx 270 TaxID=870435 RepID=A0A0C3PAI1_PISTI|nr:hypothetical protein M404DRAFT_1000471 [Pisolithus tinctorius Marx 270]